ncbi:MAG: HAD hydrolase family protein [Myxococcales bacterium]|nr:HAD hydrolase family protein [Polyangiaceae bacterium]MDW8250501.1 HAD hydrolase family protein [Myxococcales bacterium]
MAVRKHRSCRLFAVDLDGTLLNYHGRPHEVDVEALRMLRERGVAVSFVTGRLYGGVVEAVEAVGLEGPVVCADGSHIVDAISGEEHFHHPFRGETLGRLQRVFQRHGLASFLLSRDHAIHDRKGLPFLKYLRIWTERFLHHEDEITKHPLWEQDVTVLVSVGEEEKLRPLHREVQEEGGEQAQSWVFQVSWPFREEGYKGLWGMVARAPGSSKGTAVEWLARHYGCSLEEVVVVGDWYNDLPMFQVAGRSFAMGQAPDTVKSAATDVLEATAVTGGGIAEAARRAGLLP